jgi:Cu2+-containing amine oxidase
MLFAPLSEGERADAIRCLLEDDRLRGLAKVGRYRVITAEPLVVKPPEPLAGRRLARVVVYDYASDKCVDACVDLDRGAVCHVSTSTAQPMLSRDEEADAVAIADADQRVVEARGIGAVATVALHYWSLRETEFSFRRRSAAVVYATPGARPSCVAVVSLVDREVLSVVPAEKW